MNFVVVTDIAGMITLDKLEIVKATAINPYSATPSIRAHNPAITKAETGVAAASKALHKERSAN